MIRFFTYQGSSTNEDPTAMVRALNPLHCARHEKQRLTLWQPLSTDHALSRDSGLIWLPKQASAAKGWAR